MPKLSSFESINRWWSRFPAYKRGAVVIAIPSFCWFVTIGTWAWSRQSRNTAIEWVQHTQTVLAESDRLLVELLDAETAVRGYSLIHKDGFLERYHQAVKNLPVSITRLQQLTKNNELQQQLLIEIEKLTQQKIDVLQKKIESIEKAKQTAILAPQYDELIARGEELIDALRLKIDRFKAQEQQMLVSRQDISDRQKAEQQLQQRASELARLNSVLAKTNTTLAERNRELDQFAYIVSHDLKAPLRAIDNLSEWIEEDLADVLTEETQEQMNLLRGRVKRMGNLIDGILQYSRVGRTEIQPETVEVERLLAEIIDTIAPPPEFSVAIAGEMPILVTNRVLLEQVFVNLIGNAIKHHDRSDGKVTVTAIDRENCYEFAIADDGAGIAPEHQEKVFGIFQTLEARDKVESTGIGLAIVKKIIETQGGKITLESQVGAGCTFRFTWLK